MNASLRTLLSSGGALVIVAIVASAASAETYRDALTGLTFDPPAGWIQEAPMGDAASMLVRFVRPPDAAGGPRCVVAIGSTSRGPAMPAEPGPLLASDYNNFRLNIVRPPTNARLGPTIDTTVGGLPAKTMTVDADSPTGPTRVRYWFVIAADRIVTFAYGAPEPLHAAHLAEAEASIASVRSRTPTSQPSTDP